MHRMTVMLGAILIAAPALAAGDVAHGKYLATIMDCTGCHSGRTADGAIDPAQYLTGGTVGFEVPGLGIFWPPNLTPSPEGLGDWSDAEVIRVLRTGVMKDGRRAAPMMPYESYAVLTDADAADLVAYLRSLAPSPNRVSPPMAPGGDAPAPYMRIIAPK